MWAKLDDGFFRNPKARRAGKDGRELYLAGLCYCSAGLTDGHVRGGDIPLLAAEAEVDTNTAETLVSVDLWHTAGHDCPSCPPVADGDFYVHEYLERNPTREERERDKQRARDRQSKARQKGSQHVAHDPAGRFQTVSHAARHAVTDGVTINVTDDVTSPRSHAVCHPLPVPVPVPVFVPVPKSVTSPNNLESVGAPDHGGKDAPQPDENGKLRDLVTRLAAMCTGRNRQAINREAALVVGLCYQHTPLDLLDRAVTIIAPKQPVLPRFLLREVEQQRRLAGLPAVTLNLDNLVKRIPA